MTEDRDSPAPPFAGNHVAQSHHLAHRSVGGAQTGELDVERHRRQRAGQLLGQGGRAEYRESGVDPVVEFALNAVRRGGPQFGAVSGSVRGVDLQRHRQMTRQVHSAPDVESAAGQSARGVGDRIARAPAELELPILLHR